MEETRAPRLWPAAIGLALLASPVFAQGAGQVPVPGVRRGQVLPAAGIGAPVVETGRGQNFALESGNGRVLTLPGPASNVFVADPKVAEVRPASTNSLFVFGVGAGRTTIAAMDADGRVVSQFEVTVRPSQFVAGEVEGMIARLVPNARVRVVAQARGMMLTGNVNSPADAARAIAIVTGYLPKESVVENQMSVQSSIQVNLRVRVVEMNRSVTRALGIDWQAIGKVGKYAVNFATANGLAIASAAAGRLALGPSDANTIIDALATDNLVRVLAEPNLTVMSGQPGSFLAGGEYPIPVAGGGSSNQITVTYKKYGVSLSVVPTVLSDGRINLHVAPEVSSLTDQGSVQTTAGNSTLSLPALLTRRAETTVELGSGQSFAIAGLLSDNETQTTKGLPFLGDLPILGQLFRSAAFQRQETELVIVVTPYIVRPVDDPASLKAPTDRYVSPNDLERILLLRQVGGATGTMPQRVPGTAGFIVQ